MVTGAGNSGAGRISGLIAITATEQSEDHSDDEEKGNDDTHGLCQFVVVFLFALMFGMIHIDLLLSLTALYLSW